MDAETARRISELAASLKRMHLATTMEEATERAKDIILQAKTGDKDKPIQELLDGVRQSEQKLANVVSVDADRVGKTDVTLDNIKKELSRLSEGAHARGQALAEHVAVTKSVLGEDTVSHAKEEQGVASMKRDVAKKKQAVDDVRDVLDMADRVQGSG